MGNKGKVAIVSAQPTAANQNAWIAAFREEPLNRIASANVQHWLGVEERESKESRVVLRYGNGKPAVAMRSVGSGVTVLVTTSADPRWTDWPLRHTYLPFAQLALSALVEGPTAAHNRTAGEPLLWRPAAADGDKVFIAMDPDGRRSRLGVPSMTEGQPLVTVTSTARSGVHVLLKEKEPEAPGVLFAVTPDLRESEDLEAFTDSQLDERLGFTPHHLTASDDSNIFSGTERLKREWTLWVLMAVLLIAAFETILAWYCGRGW